MATSEPLSVVYLISDGLPPPQITPLPASPLAAFLYCQFNPLKDSLLFKKLSPEIRIKTFDFVLILI